MSVVVGTRRYPNGILAAFITVFDCLPIAALIDEKVFCSHGGLSPEMTDMADVRQVVRPCAVPDRGLVRDLLWSRPAPDTSDWENQRYGRGDVTGFLRQHGLEMVCRSGELARGDGYEFFADRSVVTLFSAADYNGIMNAAAVMSIDDDLQVHFQILRPIAGKAEPNAAEIAGERRDSLG
jgi:serine/threonine-protein phosphatase PP1 catalytic subunit